MINNMYINYCNNYSNTRLYVGWNICRFIISCEIETKSAQYNSNIVNLVAITQTRLIKIIFIVPTFEFDKKLNSLVGQDVTQSLIGASFCE